MEPTARVIEGDCLEVLPTLESGSVDAVVTDPPYGQTNEAYDSPIAFSPDMWRECYRVAKPNAALLSFAGSPTYHKIASAIEAAGWRVRQMWAWVYKDGMITSAYPSEGFDRLAPAFTPIVFATKGKVLLNLKREGKPWILRQQKKPTDAPYSSRSRHNGRVQQGEGHWPRALAADPGVEEFAYFSADHSGRNRGTEKTGHPNQKPLALMRWLVSKLPGTLVLDPFCGSASTGAACIAENRSFIGIERIPEYVAIARRRIADLQAQTPLFAPAPASPLSSTPAKADEENP